MALIRYNSADHDDKTQERDIFFFRGCAERKKLSGLKGLNGPRTDLVHRLVSPDVLY